MNNKASCSVECNAHGDSVKRLQLFEHDGGRPESKPIRSSSVDEVKEKDVAGGDGGEKDDNSRCCGLDATAAAELAGRQNRSEVDSGDDDDDLSITVWAAGPARCTWSFRIRDWTVSHLSSLHLAYRPLPPLALISRITTTLPFRSRISSSPTHRLSRGPDAAAATPDLSSNTLSRAAGRQSPHPLANCDIARATAPLHSFGHFLRSPPEVSQTLKHDADILPSLRVCCNRSADVGDRHHDDEEEEEEEDDDDGWSNESSSDMMLDRSLLESMENSLTVSLLQSLTDEVSALLLFGVDEVDGALGRWW
ncbi:hypothetical protein AGLY_004442 [Aphis glycines]|uniref:Uncharacterized protein n=1 Tax=Aphis glycines TaxID=307491 RepID=A0A6G0U0J5_APHGL|nr:hypothetical protein AGLY_004442 [Aphis glycines]